MPEGMNKWLAGSVPKPRDPNAPPPKATRPVRRSPPIVGPPPLSLEHKRLLACVHCGFCLTACPTYTRLGDEADSPRGRLALMRAVAEGRLPADSPAFQTHIDRCLGCRACETACPSGVEYGFLLERARQLAAESKPRSRLERAAVDAFDDRLFRTWTGRIGRALRARGFAAALTRRVPRRFTAIRSALAMVASTRPWSGLRPEGQTGKRPRVPVRPNRSGPRVALLQGCVQSALFQHVNIATRRVLALHGCTVVPAPEQVCCGALHAHAGSLSIARDRMRANLAAFLASGADYVVANAAGCGAMLKSYDEQLERDSEWSGLASTFPRKVRDVFELLLELEPEEGAPLPMRYTYDAPCHLHHGQGITDAPTRVLECVPELEHVPLRGSEECCGAAGTYALSHPELAGRILDDKIAAIKATGARVVVSPNPGCIMQIGSGLTLNGIDIPVLHPIELLDESYRRLHAD